MDECEVVGSEDGDVVDPGNVIGIEGVSGGVEEV